MDENTRGFVIDVHEGKKLFKCESCNYSCATKSSMNRHVVFVHEKNGKKSFKCEICEFTFCHSGKLKNHVAIVHEGEHWNVKFVTIAVLEKVK